MTRDVRRLRVCCWAGAAIDGLMVLPMAVPSLGARLFGLQNFHPTVAYQYAMLLAAALMLGWSALLVWAGRAPLERRAVVLLTVFPVIAGLAGAGVFAVREGFIAPGRMAPVWVGQAALATAFLHAALKKGA